MYFIIAIILVIQFIYDYIVDYNKKLNENINNWDMIYLDPPNIRYYDYLKSCAIYPDNFLKDNANEIIKKLNIQFVSQLRINIADNYDEKAEVVLDVSNIVAVNDLPFYNRYISNLYIGDNIEFKITTIKRKKTRTAIYFILCEK